MLLRTILNGALWNPHWLSAQCNAWKRIRREMNKHQTYSLHNNNNCLVWPCIIWLIISWSSHDARVYPNFTRINILDNRRTTHTHTQYALGSFEMKIENYFIRLKCNESLMTVGRTNVRMGLFHTGVYSSYAHTVCPSANLSWTFF